MGNECCGNRQLQGAPLLYNKDIDTNRPAPSNELWVIGKTSNIRDRWHLGEVIGTKGQYGHAVVATKRSNPKKATSAEQHVNRPSRSASSAKVERVVEQVEEMLAKPSETRELLADDATLPDKAAVKIIHKASLATSDPLVRDEVLLMIRHEVEVMRRMNHDNIVKLYEVFEDQHQIYLVMELCTGGELFDRITASGSLSEKDAANVFRQILHGLEHMHDKGIAHLDIKPDNMLFSTAADDSPVKIIDFGMSKFLRPRHYFQKMCGAPYYVAPEVLKGSYNESADMWSAGVMLFVILFGYPPFFADPHQFGAKRANNMIYNLIMDGFHPEVREGWANHFPAGMTVSDAAKDLIAKLLTSNPTERLTVKEALKHPWLTGAASGDALIALPVLDSLRNFTRASKLKDLILEKMSTQLGDAEIDQVKQTFKAMDTNGDGVISLEELTHGLRALNVDVGDEDAMTMIQEFDKDGNGALDYEELVMAFVNRKLNSKEERLWEKFCEIDLDGDGSLSPDEIRTAFPDVMSHNELEALIAEADQDGDGRIDYEEFLRLWCRDDDTEPTFGPFTLSSYQRALNAHTRRQSMKLQGPTVV